MTHLTSCSSNKMRKPDWPLTSFFVYADCASLVSVLQVRVDLFSVSGPVRPLRPLQLRETSENSESLPEYAGPEGQSPHTHTHTELGALHFDIFLSFDGNRRYVIFPICASHNSFCCLHGNKTSLCLSHYLCHLCRFAQAADLLDAQGVLLGKKLRTLNIQINLRTKLMF